MGQKVNPELITDLETFGVKDAATCFNCGNCTAVCSLSTESVPFPRKVIRYLQVGAKDKLVQRPEPWLCYYCGDCSRTCPRDANPGEVMMGLRRYLTSDYEPTGISRLFYRNNVFAVLLTIFLCLFLAAFLVGEKTLFTMAGTHVTRWLFGLERYHFVETMGIGIFVIAALSVLGGLIRVLTRFARTSAVSHGDNPQQGGKKSRILPAAAAVVKELFTLKRYQTCQEEENTAWYLKSWFVHWSIMWGFLGLATATVLDIPILGLKNPDVTTWLPSRILGIAAGLFLLYGTTIVIIRRFAKSEKNTEYSLFSDWVFVGFLWGLGLTGFWLTISIYFLPHHFISQVILLIHTAMAMELLLLFAFTKFAHVMYRPIALFFYHLHENP